MFKELPVFHSGFTILHSWVALVVENPPAMQETLETQGQFLGRQNTLEKGMANHSSILAWRIAWTEEPNGL